MAEATPHRVRRFFRSGQLAISLSALTLGSGFATESAASETGEPWPQWRGPGGQGHAAGKVPTEWSEEKNVAWKTTVPGRGWSSPVVGGGLVWVTTALETPADPDEAERRLKQNTGSQPLTLLDNVNLRAVGIDFGSGEIIHDVDLFTVESPQWVHATNSYASPTPVLADGRLYCHFGTFGTACVDTGEGKALWKNAGLPVMHENGPGSSPVLWGDYIIFHADGSDRQFVAALDKRSGELAWKTDRSGEMNANGQLKKAYCTPLVIERDGKAQLISPGADWLYSYDPEDGRELWRMRYGQLGFSNVARPVTGHGFLYICTGFMRSELLAVKPSEKDGGDHEVAWRYDRNVPKIPSPVVVGDELYFAADSGGIVTCLDARTGEQLWRERIAGGKYNASPLFASGRLYFHSADGVTTVIEPGRSFRKIGENRLEGKLMASAAVADGALVLRSDKAVYRIETPGVR